MLHGYTPPDRYLPYLSWTQIKTLIERRHVEVNGTLTLEEGRRVKAGDVVDVYERPRRPPPGERDVVVIHMDEHLVIVDKPAGIVTQRHPAEREWDRERKAKQPSLEEVVQRLVDQRWRERVAKMRAAGSQSSRQGSPPPNARGKHPLDKLAKMPAHPLARKGEKGPRRNTPLNVPTAPVRTPKVRAVHRLDRDTSGLMVFALSQDAEETLVRMFKKHAVERSYLAVVGGRPSQQTIETWIVRDRGDGLRGSSHSAVGAEHAERAVTHIKPVETVGPYGVVECRLETGRTHQIRIHLAEIGHPLCGERVYTHKLGEPPHADASNAPRQALHSAELRLVHPVTGHRLHFRSPLPKDLAQWLGDLRRKHVTSPH